MVNNSKFTKNSIDSPKLPLLISVIIALVLDIVATFMLYQFNYDIQYVLIPTVMVILDVVFLWLSLTSNYRYKYTILQFVAYIVLILLSVAGVALIGGVFASEVIMTLISMIIWAASHVLVCVATIITSLNAAKVMKVSSAPASIIIVLLLTVGGAVSVLNILNNGFFGQGVIEENKTLIYEYKADEDCYIVDGTLNGRGNTINVPNTFNGKDVLYFNAEALKDQSIKVLRFEERDEEISFINLDLLNENYTDVEMGPVSDYNNVAVPVETLRGPQGRGVKRIEYLTQNQTHNYYNIIFDDDSYDTFTMPRPRDGEPGAAGATPDVPVVQITKTVYKSGLNSETGEIETPQKPNGGDYSFSEIAFTCPDGWVEDNSNLTPPRRYKKSVSISISCLG